MHTFSCQQDTNLDHRSKRQWLNPPPGNDCGHSDNAIQMLLFQIELVMWLLCYGDVRLAFDDVCCNSEEKLVKTVLLCHNIVNLRIITNQLNRGAV